MAKEAQAAPTATTGDPYHFQPQAKPFAFAGVYDVWNADGKSAITRFSNVTTAAATSTAAYHDRMPVVLEKSQFEGWMRLPPEAAAEMMKSHAGAIDVWPARTSATCATIGRI